MMTSIRKSTSWSSRF